MQPNWMDYLRSLVSIVSYGVLTIAAILAYIKLRRWTLACFFIAGCLKLAGARLSNLAYALLIASQKLFGLDVSVLRPYPHYIYESLLGAVWLVAIIGAAGELLRLTRMPAEDRGRPRPDAQVSGNIISPTGRTSGEPE